MILVSIFEKIQIWKAWNPQLSPWVFELLWISRIAEGNAIKYDVHEWPMYNIPNGKFGMLHPRRLAEVRPGEWPHTPFMEEAGILQEFTQYAANAGLTDFIADECEQHQILTTSLFKVLLSFLGIIHLRCSLIYMLKPIRYHLLSFVTYAWSLLMGA